MDEDKKTTQPRHDGSSPLVIPSGHHHIQPTYSTHPPKPAETPESEDQPQPQVDQSPSANLPKLDNPTPKSSNDNPILLTQSQSSNVDTNPEKSLNFEPDSNPLPTFPAPEHANPTPITANTLSSKADQSDQIVSDLPTFPTVTTSSAQKDMGQAHAATHQDYDADKQNSQSHKEKSKSFLGIDKLFLKLFSWAFFFGAVLVAAYLINLIVFQSYYVDGSSMVPTLHDKDRLIVEKVSKNFSHMTGNPYVPQRGQIVILDASVVSFNPSNEQLIKRVIGLPGERIKIVAGEVLVFNDTNPNGLKVDEALGLKDLDPTYGDSSEEITIGENEIYVLGDNRGPGESNDSRAFGPISLDKVDGRLWARILPINQAKIFD